MISWDSFARYPGTGLPIDYIEGVVYSPPIAIPPNQPPTLFELHSCLHNLKVKWNHYHDLKMLISRQPIVVMTPSLIENNSVLFKTAIVFLFTLLRRLALPDHFHPQLLL